MALGRDGKHRRENLQGRDEVEVATLADPTGNRKARRLAERRGVNTTLAQEIASMGGETTSDTE